MEVPMFIARVMFWGHDKGGRSIPPQSGYHPQGDAGGGYTSCAIESLGTDTVFAFDREHLVSLRLLFPDRYRHLFAVGSAVRFYEGHHAVGEGTILEVRA
jgi:hypothetical protein